MGRLRTKRERDSYPSASAWGRYRVLFENSREGICLTSAEGRFVDANPALLDLLGLSREELIGRRVTELSSDPSGGEQVQERIVAEGFVKDAELRIRQPDGQERVCTITMLPEKDRAGTVTGYHGIVHDVTAKGAAEERARQSALYDPLTQLPSRTFLLDRAGRLLERVLYRGGAPFAVLVLEVNCLRLINDSLGRSAGDELLVQLAERLPLLVRPQDIVAKFGGDTFAILLMDLHGAEDAETISARIRDGLIQPFQVLGSEVYVSASIGIAVSHEGYRSAEEMLRDAGTAVYVARGDGASRWAVFDTSMRDRAVSLLDLETSLQRALGRGEFLFHYQPIVAMQSERVVGFEALLRWKHPKRGLLAPDAFLPVAEASGVLASLGEWALGEACRTAALWRAEGLGGDAPPTVAVNLSGRQLMAPGLVPRLRVILEEHRVPGSALRIEITESVFLERSALVLETLAQLTSLGILLCLDDFGTGYSSLSFLRDLPVDVLKIDRSFVERLPDAGGSDMVGTILALARQLGLATVAEGVETEAQRDALLRLGCEHAQGYLFSAPVDGERARALLGNGARDAGTNGGPRLRSRRAET
jgi:diguanylate cyclase (GGDEF)-like protein/PAS domain S-box-containing protein